LILGYESFEAFGFSVLGHEKAYLHRLATAAHIQNIVRPIGLETIPESHLRRLLKIEPADRQDVWNDAIEKARS
jgi:hypothetical protein